MTAGDITRRDRVIWTVTLRDAAAWARAALRQRYEWLEWVAQALGAKTKRKGKETREKRCRHPLVCRICRKPCTSRLTEH